MDYESAVSECQKNLKKFSDEDLCLLFNYLGVKSFAQAAELLIERDFAQMDNGEIQIATNNDLKELRSFLKSNKDSNYQAPKRIKNDSIILVHKIDEVIVAFLHVYFFDKTAQFNYSYTAPIARRKGLSTKLRLKAINMAKNRGMERVISIPFEGANSKPLLEKLGFEPQHSHFVLYL